MLKPTGEARASRFEDGSSRGFPSWNQGAYVQSNLFSLGSRQRTDLGLGKFFHRQMGGGNQGRSELPVEPQPGGGHHEKRLTTSRKHWEAQRSTNFVGSMPKPKEHALR